MSKKWLIMICCGLLAMTLVVGCSDDDCTTCPEVSTPKGYVYGTLVLDPEAYLDDMQIHGYGAIPPNIDSVKVGDSLVDPDDWDYEYEWEYEDNFWEIYFDEDGSTDTYMWNNGDIATVKVWGEGSVSTCSLKMLDDDTSVTEVIQPLYDDTIDFDENVTVHWTTAKDADYYSVWLEYRTVVNGSSLWLYHYDYSLDTTYAIDASAFPDSLVYFYVNVTPFNGPDPRTGESNWTGGFLVGRLYSYGEEDYVRIQIRQQAAATKANTVIVSDEDRPRITPLQAIEKIYEGR